MRRQKKIALARKTKLLWGGVAVEKRTAAAAKDPKAALMKRIARRKFRGVEAGIDGL